MKVEICDAALEDAAKESRYENSADRVALLARLVDYVAQNESGLVVKELVYKRLEPEGHRVRLHGARVGSTRQSLVHLVDTVFRLHMNGQRVNIKVRRRWR